MAKTTKKTDISDVKSDEVKLVETKAAEKKAEKAEKKPAKKAAAPKAEKKPAEKKAEKKTEKKPAAKSAKAPAVKAVVEYRGVQVSLDDIVAAIKADWKGEAIKTLEVYVKPEDAAAYYVVNGAESGKVSL